MVVLTRNKGYRKADKEMRLPGFIYRQYPALREQLRTRYLRYNATLDWIDQLEAAGRVLIIRPEKPLQVDRTCRNIPQMQALYQEGYQLAERLLPLFQ